jgi:hypothetical protein
MQEQRSNLKNNYLFNIVFTVMTTNWGPDHTHTQTKEMQM